MEANWVSCKERMPEKAGTYLVTVPIVYCQNVRDVELRIALRVGDEWIFREERGIEIEYDSPVAWMELPEMYEETEDEA